jgi:hypothetical protein
MHEPGVVFADTLWRRNSFILPSVERTKTAALSVLLLRLRIDRQLILVLAQEAEDRFQYYAANLTSCLLIYLKYEAALGCALFDRDYILRAV